jgi:hypothetical protein
MNCTRFAAQISLALTLLGTHIAAAHDRVCEVSPLVGAWTLAVTPQRNPDVEGVPPPFTALFVFESGGTLTETDTGFHPTAAVPIFPELGLLSSSDGLGSWELDASNRYRGQFIKNLFNPSGQHVGYLVSRITITQHGRDRIEARTETDIVLGSDLNAEPYFSGGVSLATGTRMRAPQ